MLAYIHDEGLSVIFDFIIVLPGIFAVVSFQRNLEVPERILFNSVRPVKYIFKYKMEEFKPPLEALVFQLTMEEFRNPIAYLTKIRPVVVNMGICKIHLPSVSASPAKYCTYMCCPLFSWWSFILPSWPNFSPIL